jgi:hypothetical protein
LSLLAACKPFLELRRRDAEAFIEFCLNPPTDWTGPVVKSRFLRIGGRKKLESDNYILNAEWRPFRTTIAKRERKVAAESVTALPSRAYRMSQGSVAQVFAVCGSFFQHAIDEGLTEVNPFRAVKQNSIYKQCNTQDVASRSLIQLQWSFVIETAEIMATEDSVHERMLFIVATLFAMYLRVSDLVGRDNWTPTMGDIRRDSTGNWWFHVVGKGNKAAKISIRDDDIQNYLIRYRQHLQRPPLPSAHEKTPLISTLQGPCRTLRSPHPAGAAGCVRPVHRADGPGRLERRQDRPVSCASLHWLRHTSATFDAPHRGGSKLYGREVCLPWVLKPFSAGWLM